MTACQDREELYNSIERGVQLDNTFLLRVCLSTVVASIGLIENNVAVVVGAMVIAPFPGPNIALSFGASPGDSALIGRAPRPNFVGVGLTLLMPVVTGALWPVRLHGSEIMARTDVGMAGVILALVSGAAAVLSPVTGLSSTRMLRAAGLLARCQCGMHQAVGQLTFWYKGVKPRTWLEKSRARKSFMISMLFWVTILGLLMNAIILRHRVAD